MIDAVSKVVNNCEIISRLAKGDLTQEQLDNIAVSLMSGRPVADVEQERRGEDMFDKLFRK